MSTRIKEAIHPETMEIVKEGDVVLIYQGRFGHNNIMTIKSLWNHGNWIGVSPNEEEVSTNISAIKKVYTGEELRKLKKDISTYHRVKYVEDLRFINDF